MTHIVTVTSQKGGVAKTTTAVSMAAGLGRNYRVLLVDFDPQGHASIAVGIDPAPGIFRFFVNEEDGVCRATDKNLMLLPGNSRTRTAESVLRAESTPAAIIQRFDLLRQGFDYIVIDTPPGGLLQEVAIRMADDLIIPVRCEVLGLDGVAATLQMAEQIGNPAQVLILPTMFDLRLTEHNLNFELLRRNYPSKVCDPVPARVAVAEAVAMGKTVWEHGNGAMMGVRNAYEAVLARIAEVR